MATAQATFTTAYGVHRYLTLAEYKTAPTAVDTTNLVYQGTPAQQDAELLNVITRASGMVNTICDQTLAATLDVETQRMRITRRGELIIHPKYWPIKEATDIQYGVLPNSLIAIADLTSVWIEPTQIICPLLGSSSFLGQLQFSAPRTSDRLYVRFAYVNGWADSTLTVAATQGATTITVADSTGMYGGPATPSATATTAQATNLTIYDGALTEVVSVASKAGNVLTLNSALQFAHAAGVSVSELPAEVKEAAVLLATALIHARGNEAIVASSIDRSGTVQAIEGVSSADLGLAYELLHPFRRRI